MSKAISSNIQVSVRIVKEQYDDQYQECFSTLGNNEIEIKLGKKLILLIINVRIKIISNIQNAGFPET